MNKKYWNIFITGLLCVFFLAGCLNSDDKGASKKPLREEKPEAPSSLKKIISDIDKINEELMKKVKEEKELKAKKKQEKESANDEGGQDKKTKSEKFGSEMGLNKEKELLGRMYREWNMLEPELVKEGINKSERENFQKGLDELGKAVQEESKADALLAGLKMYKHYADISRFFAVPVPADFYMVKYEALTAATLAENRDFDKARKHLPAMLEYWNMLKVQKKQADAKLLNQVEFSLYDLKQVIENKEGMLLVWKTEVVKGNFEQLEDSLSGM
ncbi:hypothetical protein [Thermosyntropha sp.]|uniref:hypothetical protein n=1 Tax=Thermosyntropha sp. TaxID=2740820 RepID=UPI002600966A|nr:hypothetical protein [Thermosyntropha sp.]MBO8158968.1 hypothetical protein [Thermosyntropha sp.]